MKRGVLLLAVLLLAGCGAAKEEPGPAPFTPMKETVTTATTAAAAAPRGHYLTARRGGWLRVLASERPNGRAAWIRASLVRLDSTDYSIHVDRSARRLTLRHGRRAVGSFPVAVGRPGTETPTGRFAVTDKLHPDDPASPYGCCLLALSGHQTKLIKGWPGGDRLAIHATPSLWTVGKAASLGCMRARPGDIRRLMRRVPAGTPVFVRA